MSEKIKGMFGSKTRADEVSEWLKRQGATPTFPLNVEHYIYHVYQGKVEIASKEYANLFDIVELPRWRAIKEGVYFYVADRGCVDTTYDTDSVEHQERFECGNYFKTKEEAESYVEKIRDIFKGRREK